MNVILTKKKSVDKTIQFCEKKKTSEKIRLQKNKVYAWKEDEKNITIQSSKWDFVYSLLKWIGYHWQQSFELSSSFFRLFPAILILLLFCIWIEIKIKKI